MGAFRLFLALSVLAQHTTGAVFGFHGFGAWASVQVFYIISGFLITLILNEKYVGEGGTQRFYVNRLLRLLPLYVCGAGIALAVMAYTHDLEPRLLAWQSLTWPFALLACIANLALVGSDWLFVLCVPSAVAGACADPVMLFVNMPSWSLGVELVFYAMAPLLVRSRWRVVGFCAAGLAWQISLPDLAPLLHERLPLAPTLGLTPLAYFASPSSFLYFGLGALAWHSLYRPLLGARKVDMVDYLAVAAATVGTVMIVHTPLLGWSTMLFCALVPVLFRITARFPVDDFLGQLSFPVYILHYPIVLLVWHWRAALLDPSSPLANVPLATTATLVTLPAAAAMMLAVEQPVDRLRQAIYRRWQAGEPDARPARSRTWFRQHVRRA